MKYVREVFIIITFTFIGELLHAFLPLPVPAGVYGLFLLLGSLILGFVKLPDVEPAGDFLLDTMTMMFIPAGVAIMDSFGVLLPVLGPYLLIIAVSTILVMSLTGLCAQGLLSRMETAESCAAEAAEPQVETTIGLGHRILHLVPGQNTERAQAKNAMAAERTQPKNTRANEEPAAETCLAAKAEPTILQTASTDEAEMERLS